MIPLKVKNQFAFSDKERNIDVYIKREDLIHPFVSGNKFRKLKYNLAEAKKQNCTTLLTFGGAFSNHIAAVAFAGKFEGLKTIGIIRGDELAEKINDNPTLKFASENGMQFEFVSRDIYRNKTDKAFLLSLKEKFGDFYLIPEGGTNELAVKGCTEILTEEDKKFNYIVSAVGTGGTIAGIIKSSLSNQQVLGFPALKGDFLQNEIRNFVSETNWQLVNGFEFGGYGKVTPELITFMNDFYAETQILLDPIYTAKMVFGVRSLIKDGFFADNSRILMIHTGGIQGIAGINNLLEKKKLPKINRND
ncbi:1-aminocyclopropane-1-carboxylate deaminase/D-cysteine desulfhydrase [Flavobacterium tegetincola]|uniref:1-aminocyclopropane-1-carboxylate deaminase/D-cysteine desulfhydrase n=1 Tax=Flavobacterium tegetincola TaxID=150172 RepID=UPI000421F612|nr:pyridoxal-phosphate dependent enzyme [Flavobacterium tegetincola]